MYFTKISGQSTEELFKELAASEAGLSKSEVEKRQKIYGLNQMTAHEVKWWQIFGRQFKSPFIYLLLFAAGLSIFLGEKIDGIMIVSFVVINTVLGYIQEYHSEKSLKLLKKFVIARARVRRAGKQELIPSKELVPGDLVLVETGDVMPADLRFIKVKDLNLDESILTGESVMQSKQVAAIKSGAQEIYEAKNLGFSGTTVMNGEAEGLVIATGKNTVIGEVAKLTTETHRESPFEVGIAKFSKFILQMILVILVLVFVLNLIIKGPSEKQFIEMLLFAIALAVSVIPEALPVVTTLSLSRGALRLAHNKVVVKRLAAVEDLGSIEILCTDKTGTITENKLSVAAVEAGDEKKCLFYATLASSFLTADHKQSEPNNSFDLALWQKLTAAERKELAKYPRLAEIPFSPERRRNSVLVKDGAKNLLIVRGAAENILPLCKDKHQSTGKIFKHWIKTEGLKGRRVLAIALRPGVKENYTVAEEKDLEFCGLISFVDPIKPTTHKAVMQAKELGVDVKIITGDSAEVAGAVATEIKLITDPKAVITGEELDCLKPALKEKALQEYSVFARVSPQQKYEIISLLQKHKEVGFLGEGINDAPALKLANVAIVVEGASDIAREAADIVLLKSGLHVIIEGIKSGREVFANTVKYLKITLISNFGNFYAVACASLIITFLPMLPVQLLLLNLLSDFPMIAIAMDSVDSGELRRPRTYQIKEVVLMAIVLGLVSTVFDFIFFGMFVRSGEATLQTNWFMGSVLTELALIYSVRTKLWFWRAKAPSKILSGLCVFAVLTTIILPFTELGHALFKFKSPTINQLLIIFGIACTYFCITEVLKKAYLKFTNK